MAAGRKHASLLSLVIIPLTCVITLDIGLFFILPLSYLYPFSFQTAPVNLKVAAVLFNGFNDNYSGINDETKRRVNHGITLLKNNRVDQLIVVGGNREKSAHKGAHLMADYMAGSGISPESILVEDTSNDSFSNLAQIGNILQEKNIDAVGLISSPYHLLRIKKIQAPFNGNAVYYAYNPANCSPPITRKEIWFSAHYNALAYIAHVILPKPLYKKIVLWIRENTEW